MPELLSSFIGFFLSAFSSAYPTQSANSGQQRTLDAALRAWDRYVDEDQLDLAEWARERIEFYSTLAGEQQKEAWEGDRNYLSEAITYNQQRNGLGDPFV